MQRWHDFGKNLLLYVSSFSVWAVSLCLCLLLLQGREAILSGERNGAALVRNANTTLTTLNATAGQINTTLNTTAGRVNTVVDSANVLVRTATGSVQRVNRALDEVNHPCVPGPCGTLADVAKTLNTVRGTAGEVEIAVHHEDKNLDTLDSQEAALYDEFHATLNNTNALLTSPDVKNTLANAADLTKQADGTVTDLHTLADKYTHPSKKKLTFWTATEAAGDYLRHFMPPIF